MCDMWLGLTLIAQIFVFLMHLRSFIVNQAISFRVHYFVTNWLMSRVYATFASTSCSQLRSRIFFGKYHVCIYISLIFIFLSCPVVTVNIKSLSKLISVTRLWQTWLCKIFRHASVSSNYPCQSVRWSVHWWYFLISILAHK